MEDSGSVSCPTQHSDRYVHAILCGLAAGLPASASNLIHNPNRLATEGYLYSGKGGPFLNYSGMRIENPLFFIPLVDLPKYTCIFRRGFCGLKPLVTGEPSSILWER
jgi:hypothetical protein